MATIKADTKRSSAPSKAPSKSVKSGGPQNVSQEQRRNYVEVAAYYIAERRDFVAGDPMDDWAAAEAEIDRLLAEGRLNH